MSEADYKSAITAILRSHSASALENLRLVKQHLPSKARMVLIGVHPGQSEEGYFDVHVHLDGPDLYVLNKAIAPYRSLFEVSCVDGRVIPDVPMHDQSEVAFSVNDAIVDVCMDWIEKLWAQLGGIGLPAQIFGEDDYGTVSNKPLMP